MTIKRIPLEDMKELWLWGPWKEPMPIGFSTKVLVVCTSREACRRYFRKRNSDYWLLSEDDSNFGAEPDLGEIASSPDDDLFESSPGQQSWHEGQFRLFTFSQLVEEVRREEHNAGAHGLAVVVNPQHDGNTWLEGDAMFSAKEFLATFAVD
jgi:hypothetical protein